jgi:hypothetical protein
MWFMALLLSALAAGCGSGDKGAIFGTGGAGQVVAPTVTAVAPLANAVGVPIGTKIITAAFSKPMGSATLSATSFTLACPGGVAVAGAVTYVAAGSLATLTLPAAPNLPPTTVCTGTITTGAMDTTSVPLAANFVWTFTTGVTPDTTRPRVTLTVPVTTIPGPTAGVATNTAISAVFTEDMAPASINAASFTVTCGAPCVSPAGVVSYAVGSRTAVFTPAAVLTAGTTYTATITTAATDLAGNQLAGNQAALPAASNYVWTFATAAVIPPANVSVLSTNPLAAAVGVCPSATVNATFTVPSGLRMDPLTVNSATFTVTGPLLNPVAAATVALDVPTGRIATFTPLAPLTNGVLYTATIKGGATGVKDLAIPANTMTSDFTWTFTAGPATGACQAPIALGSASTFGAFGGAAGITNQGILTIINGDIGTTGASSLVTGFHDAGPGCIYTETGANIGTVNGGIFTAPPPPTVACPTEGTGTAAPPVGTFGIATVALADAQTAFNATSPASLPGGGNPGGNLSGLTLAPGVWTAPAGSFLIQDGLPGPAGDLTLDGQGNANAVWVFQTATTLTVGGPGAAFPRSVKLINGAQAKNVFWHVGSAATINAGGGGTMVGTIISSAATSFSTAGNVTIVTLNGRALALNASVTMVNTIINVPAP